MNIRNIYKECDISLTNNMVNTLTGIDNEHHLIVGDLNSQNTSWGSQSTSGDGFIWEEFANDLSLVILNDGSPTLLNTQNTLTAVDVSMSTGDLASSLFWSTLYSPEVADHFPILINSNKITYRKRFQPKFLENRANWSNYSSKITSILEDFLQSTNINRESAR